MRTQDEIAARAKAAEERDLFGFETEVYLTYLDYEHAKPFIKPEVTAAEWGELYKPCTDDDVRATMQDYYGFAWDKARNHRGLSAERSVQKLGAWLYVLGDDAALVEFEGAPYGPYGAPKLAVLGKRYGWAIPGGTAAANMAAGRPCVEDCEEGCRG